MVSLADFNQPVTHPIHELHDRVRYELALFEETGQCSEGITPRWIKDATAQLANNQLELLFRPSRKPGEENGQRYTGAGSKQLQMKLDWEAKERFIAAGGANRSGKTQGIGGIVCLEILHNLKDGDIIWVIAQDWDMMNAVPQKFLWDFLPRSMFPDSLEYKDECGFGKQRSSITLTLPNNRGKVIVRFKNEKMDLNKYESEPVALIWYTEPSKEQIFDAIQTRLVDKAGKLYIDYLPRFGWLKYKVRLSGDFKVYQVGMADNAHNLPDGEIDKVIKRYKNEPAEVAVRVYGKEASAFGTVFPQFQANLDGHICKRFPLPKEAKRALYRCYDYGFRNPSACLWASLLPAGFKFPSGVGSVWDGKELDCEVLLIYREYYKTGQTLSQQANEIIAMSGNNKVLERTYQNISYYREVFEREHFRMDMVSDPSIFNTDQAEKGESKAAILDRNGLRAKRGKRANASDGASLVAKVRLWFEDNKIVFFEDCENAIREHEIWRHKENSNGEAPSNEPYEDRNNHTCDALKELVAEQLVYHQPRGRIVDIPLD
ncbi:hypothetical protein KS4_23350 [Poriferisphaera corsica]|uniref:Phage terminase large subunit N-terminal domain-containing protein n=1 Tax=Poriferisphaera corsica TaxID=2528020 RepID=A0A517YVK6_9BACT|nr:hypothetical protein [Poriferisphaera corsica]QDU34268.1 hypothetical protein KS4_23350 [Poriferisphaera corsica]